jgi:hypothetical protein
MTTIFEAVATALDSVTGVPYGMDTYMSTEELPDQYMVYNLIDGVAGQHADDAETLRAYRVQINIYDRAGLADLPDVDAAMLAAGFTKGPERPLPYNAGTGHYGLAKDYFYLA